MCQRKFSCWKSTYFLLYENMLPDILKFELKEIKTEIDQAIFGIKFFVREWEKYMCGYI